MAFLDKFGKKEEKEEKGKEEEIELKPAEVKASLDKIGILETNLNKLTEKTSVLDRMTTFLDEQDRAKNDKAAAEAKAKREAASADLDEEFITDPKEATRKMIQPLVETTINTQSQLITRELMEGNQDRFELYSDPTFKANLNNMIARLPMSQRTDVASIENCYFVTEGRLKQEIKDGKIKSRFAASSSSSNGADGSGTGKGEKTIILSDAQKKAAKVFGMTEDAYAKAAEKEQAYV